MLVMYEKSMAAPTRELVILDHEIRLLKQRLRKKEIARARLIAHAHHVGLRPSGRFWSPEKMPRVIGCAHSTPDEET